MVLLRLPLLLTAAFALLIGLFRMPDYHPVPALTPCANPCWQGLQVHDTTRDQALAVMNGINGSEPRFARCYDNLEPCELYQWTMADDDAVGSVVEIRQGKLYMLIDKPLDLTLGEMLLALQHLDLPLDEYRVTTRSGALLLQLWFSNFNLSVEAAIVCPTAYLTLMQTPILFVAINPPVPSTQVETSFRMVRQNVYDLCEV